MKPTRRAALPALAVATLLFTNVDVAAQPRPASRAREDVRLEAPGRSMVPGPPLSIAYWLRTAAPAVAIEVLDSTGRVIRRYEGPSGEGTPTAHAGQNHFAWDLRHAGPVPLDAGAPGATAGGPLATPGRYQLRVTADGRTTERAVVLEKAPAWAAVSDDALASRFERALEARDRASEINQAILDIRAMKEQVSDRAKHAKSPPVGLAADVVNRKLGEVEKLLVPLSTRLADLRAALEAPAGGPGEGAVQTLKDVSEGRTTAFERLRGVLRNEVAAFNRMLGNAQMEQIDVPERWREPVPKD